jgi:hypothetical protein
MRIDHVLSPDGCPPALTNSIASFSRAPQSGHRLGLNLPGFLACRPLSAVPLLAPQPAADQKSKAHCLYKFCHLGFVIAGRPS